ncbi:UNVERIFIED_ORG: carbohydrate ABC transporter permease (plasmid) [Roseateles sp. XES5]|nr:carbohydrate ABC transporter permease [Roseateles sp. XES5]
MNGSSVSKVKTAIMTLISLVFIVPLLFLVGTALRTRQDYVSAPGGLPKSFTIDNIVLAWTQANLGQALLMSLVVSVIACLVCISTALPGAFWFRLHKGRVASKLSVILIAGYAVPIVAWLIPVFVVLAGMRLINNVAIAGIIEGVASLPFAIYLIQTFFRQSLTEEVLEAARLDGAGVIRSFWHIGVPLSRPALASVIALVFVWTFGDLLVAATLLQGDPSAYTLTLAATTLSTRETVNLQGQAGAALVSLIPMLLVFVLAQKSLAAGFGGGSEK